MSLFIRGFVLTPNRSLGLALDFGILEERILFGNSELLRIRIIRDDESVVLIDIRVFILDRWTSPKADGHHIITDIFIQCFSQINLFRVVVVSPAFGRDTNQKKTRIART